MSDAQGRSVGALQNRAVAERMRGQLAELTAAMTAGEVGRARELAASVRASLADGRAQLATYPGDGPDLTAIELALLAGERLLN
jgi:hypothetical protein